MLYVAVLSGSADDNGVDNDDGNQDDDFMDDRIPV
jgi:hypothetical protein